MIERIAIDSCPESPTITQGRLVIVVMHELGLVARFCDRAVLLSGGVKVAEGTPEALLTAERLREVYRVEPEAAGGLDRFRMAP